MSTWFKRGRKHAGADGVRTPVAPSVLPLAERLVKKTIAFAATHGAKVVGLTSDRSGAGVSVIAGQIAAGYASLGNKVLLADLRGAEADAVGAGQAAGSGEPHASSADSNIVRVDLTSLHPTAARQPAYFRELIEGAAREHNMVVVDLPPISFAGSDSAQAIIAAGSACDLVFVVCVTGATSRDDLTAYLETCKTCGIKVGGIILNDWALPFRNLLSTR